MTAVNDVRDETARLGGAIHATWGFGLGSIIGVALVVLPVPLAASVLTLSEAQVAELSSTSSRLALVVAAAALVAFVGVLLDVLHSADTKGGSLAVRQCALIAGTIGFYGSWLAMPPTLHEATTTWVVAILVAVIVFTFLVGAILRARKAIRKPNS